MFPILYARYQFFLPPLRKGRWVGFDPNIRDTLTFHILAEDTHQIIYLSAVHSALIMNEKNLHIKIFEREDGPQKSVKQVLHTWDTESDIYETPLFSPLKPDYLVGHTFLTTLMEDSQWLMLTLCDTSKKLMILQAKFAPNS